MSNQTNTHRLTAELTREQCVELLGYGSYVGHVGFMDGAKISILPVNYLFENSFIYIRTHQGSLLAQLDAKDVAFQVDHTEALERSGWSVLVNGRAEAVDSEDEIERLRRGPLRAWAWAQADQWVRISVDTISGRSIGEAKI